MKILGKELIAAVTVVAVAAVSQTSAAPIQHPPTAETETDQVPTEEVPVTEATPAEGCVPVHMQLRQMGASHFSKTLIDRGMDFKYGQYTIFAPRDELFDYDTLSATFSDAIVFDVTLFHVSAKGIAGDIHYHCNRSLTMLNEELHVNPEKSLTECSEDGTVYQVGPGNTPDTKPLVVGPAIPTCDGVIYAIEGALMLPTISDVKPVTPDMTPGTTMPDVPSLRPTPSPVAISSGTGFPVPVVPSTLAPTSAGSRRWSSVTAAAAVATSGVLVLSLLG
eukprot:jgi/Psemu1/437/gm1.437_g